MPDKVGIMLQTTIRNSINCTGTGLHSGETVRMCLRPAPAATGIVFVRTDLERRIAKVPAMWDLVTETTLGTTLTNEHGVSIATVEHLMSALAGAGIDNVFVELDGPEVPIMDGSSAPFLFLIDCAGIRRQESPRTAIEILDTVRVEDGDKWVTLEPADRFEVSFSIDFPTPVIASQSFELVVNEASYKAELARARTFGFAPEVDYLRSRGLARGGSLDNAVVIDGDRVLNEGGLRFEDEFVRHKALDAVGDLYLAGAPILGRYTGHKAGHALNNRLLRRLFAEADAWRMVPMTQTPLRTAAPAFAAVAL